MKKALTGLAVSALPSLNADLVAVLVARVVPEYIVARPAEFRAGRVVVMVGALHSDPVGEVSVPALMVERVPRRSG